MTTYQGDHMTDDIDHILLNALMQDSRLSIKALARLSGLSSPSVSERLKRLEERNILTGYTITINPVAFGYLLQAIVRIRPLPGQMHTVERRIAATPEFTECDKVTGEDCFVARLDVKSMAQLDAILDTLADHAQTSTAIIKSTPVARRLPPLTAAPKG
ncbi:MULTISPECIES: Lrp/AsnC family transcriptional regulator [Alcaligenaceae]|uniref:Lrp/AsnC family transcriptional regulator n=1 Tax=Paracandidimonas lactea TaxID=2895524 RepID=UPI001EF05353|nr:Lrp/AsnC family transcriptional regulator [Paracandidimonas lactea]